MNVCSSPPGPRAPSRHFGASHELRRCDLAAPDPWDVLWEYTGQLGFRIFENNNKYERNRHILPLTPPPPSGGALKFGVGAKPQPPQTRPFGRVHPASLGGGAGEPAGRRGLSQGHPQAPARPLRAHERRAASTSAARSVRAPLAASVEAKHTLSAAQAAPGGARGVLGLH